MDLIARRLLLERIYAILENDDTLPVVSVADFFNGNTDEASIGVNLNAEDHIGLSGFREVLEGIESRPDVRGVYLELTEIPDLDEEDDDDIWPTACVAFILTSATLETVGAWTQGLRPRDLSYGWSVKPGIRVPVPEVDLKQDGFNVVRVWLL